MSCLGHLCLLILRNRCTYATNVHISKLAVQTNTAFILEHEIPCTVQKGSSHISVNIPILIIPFLSLTSQSTFPFCSYHFSLSHLSQHSHFVHTTSLPHLSQHSHFVHTTSLSHLSQHSHFVHTISLSHISVNIPILIIPFLSLSHISVNSPILIIPFSPSSVQTVLPSWSKFPFLSYHFSLLLSRHS